MRDGVRLSANVFRPSPAPPGPGPAILIRQPYGKDEHPTMWARGKYWARKGYACVDPGRARQVRLRGRWQPFVARGARTAGTRSTGSPPSRGATAISAWPVSPTTASPSGPRRRWATRTCAASRPATRPRTRTAWPTGAAPSSSRWRSGPPSWRGRASPIPPVSTPGTCRWRPWTRRWACRAQPSRTSWRIRRGTPSGRASTRGARRPRVRIPVLHWGGWYDVLLHGTLAGWERGRRRPALRAPARRPVARDRAHRSHAHPGRLRLGGRLRTAPPAPGPSTGMQRFFDHYLRGEDAAFRRVPARQRLRHGRRALARRRHVAPARGAPTGLLPARRRRREHGHRRRPPELRRAGARSPSIASTYDPRDPVDTWLGESAWDLSWALKDRSEVERRADVLVYTSEPLVREMEVTGPLTMTLYAVVVGREHRFLRGARGRLPRRLCAPRSGGDRPRGRRRPAGPALPLAPGAVAEYSDRPRRHELPLRARPPAAARGLEQHLRALRPQPQHGAAGGARRRWRGGPAAGPPQPGLPIADHPADVPAEAAPDAGPVGAPRRATDRRHLMRARVSWLSEAEKELIVQAALGLLERVGIGPGRDRPHGGAGGGRRAGGRGRPASCASPGARQDAVARSPGGS